MLAILEVKMQWTKENRSPQGAARRKQYFNPIRLEPTDILFGDGIFVKKCVYTQQENSVLSAIEPGAFYSLGEIDIPCVEILEETDGSYRIKWHDSEHGMPRRRGGNEDLYKKGTKFAGRPNLLNETACILQKGEAGVLKYNYRLTSYHGQWYDCYYIYIVNTEDLSRNLFIRQYDYEYNQLADLF